MPSGAMMIVIAITVVIVLNMILTATMGNNMREISYNQFLTYLEGGYVESVELLPDRIMITLAPVEVDEAVPTPTPQPPTNLFNLGL